MGVAAAGRLKRNDFFSRDVAVVTPEVGVVGGLQLQKRH